MMLSFLQLKASCGVIYSEFIKTNELNKEMQRFVEIRNLERLENIKRKKL